MNKKYNVVGIGNAIVDISCQVEEDFLTQHHLTKGAMALIDDQGNYILSKLKHTKISSGGSVANTVATLSMLGSKTALIGKVGNDKFGDIFFKDLKEINCNFFCKHKEKSGATAKSFILLTPDGERTMCTYLGLANNIADEVDKKIIKDADILYLEGYLWDTPETIASMREAIEIAREGYDVEGYADEVKDDEEDPNHTKVAFTLSDAFCVDRHKIDFMDLLSHIDILFANYMEMQIFIGEDFAENNYKKVVETIKNHNPNLIIAMTHSEYGAIVFEGIKKIHNSPTTKIKKITDATGAGDAFAAGFLSGFSRNLPLDKCANLGNLLAGNVIQKLGARLEKEDVAKLTINN